MRSSRNGWRVPISRRPSTSSPKLSAPRVAAAGCWSGWATRASDPIDELLARALQYQRVEASSLQGFLRWFEAGGGEIKRDLDANRRREVRILTVHASKACRRQSSICPIRPACRAISERLLAAEDGNTRLWLPRTDDANEAAREWRAEVRRRSLQEQNRLRLRRHDPGRGPPLRRRLDRHAPAGSRLLVRPHRRAACRPAARPLIAGACRPPGAELRLHDAAAGRRLDR